jgi:TorA maturation chaperone TorD
MELEFNNIMLGLAFRFYARGLQFPYDELTHELQHMLREAEKLIITPLDNTVAAQMLDVLNYYQGEAMVDLQSEYGRLFSASDNPQPPISLFWDDHNPKGDFERLLDDLEQSPLAFDQTDLSPDTIPNLLDYFAWLLEENDPAGIDFFSSYLQPTIPVFTEAIYKMTVITYYRELARGLNNLLQWINI